MKNSSEPKSSETADKVFLVALWWGCTRQAPFRTLWPLVAILIFAVPGVALASPPAFIGAQGAGAETIGGRGGVVYQVTNLNDSGPGSLRAGVEMSGPRTIVFRVSGTIVLKNRIAISNPYITIAGQTAPGGGIQLVGEKGTNFNGLILVNTHDVIIRFLRLRMGNVGEEGLRATYGIHIGDMGLRPVHNVIVDHVSIHWAHDENFTIWGSNGTMAPRRITLQNSISAEVLDGHSTHIVVGGVNPDVSRNMTDLDFHGNLLANSSHRQPLIQAAERVRWVNNIIYNWGFYASQSGPGVHVDYIGNLYKAGPLAKNDSRLSEIQVFLYDPDRCNSQRYMQKDPSIYASGNSGPFHGSDNWEMVKRVSCENGSIRETLPTQYRRGSPLAAAGVPITVRTSGDLEEHVLPDVGASRRLDCLGNWVSNRDSADARIVKEYADNQGKIVKTELDVGGFPRIASGEPCLDTDGDGMPDAWEEMMGLDPSDPSDRNRVNASGYTMLEVYLNGLTTGAPGAPTGVRVQ
jgi:pectate lyase